MSTLTQDDNLSRYQIRGYKPGWLKINDTIFNRSVILTPNQCLDHWAPQDSSELTIDAFADVLLLKPAILLIGTGSAFKLLNVSCYGELINQGIGVEIMDTGAACRTFNALSAENRDVAAALLIR